MNTYNIKITKTEFTPFNSLCSSNIFDGGSFIDPMASPLSFFYPNTANAGTDSVSFSGEFSISSQETYPQSLFFKNDGKKAYVLGNIYDRLYEYDLSVPWQISTSIYNNQFFSVNSEETYPTSIFFKNDGSKMYITGKDTYKIYQYFLTNYWDISSASYDSKSFSLSAQQNEPRGIFFKPDGTKMYVVGTSGSKIHQYTLSNPWDISSSIYDSKSFSVSSQETNPEGISIKNDGSKIFIIGSKNIIFEYNLLTPWDISSISYEKNLINLSNDDAFIKDLFIKNDGKDIYLLGLEKGKIFHYSAKYPFDFRMNNDNYSLTALGNSFKVLYDDLNNMTQHSEGKYIFCDSEVVFDLSKFDETVSKITKVIFDPDNGDTKQTFTTYISNNSAYYPTISSIKTKYYPSEFFYTYYNPNFKLIYNDGTKVNIIVPLTSIQCGLFDTYESKKILDCLPYYKNISNAIIFLNDTKDKSISINEIYTRIPFVLSANIFENDIQLENIIKPTPRESTVSLGVEPKKTTIKSNNNPVLPPLPNYIYSQSTGVSIVINNTPFYNGNEFATDNSILILSGGAPYFGGTGVHITVISNVNI